MRPIALLLVPALVVLLVAASPIDRFLVEDGSDTTISNGATDGGQVLVGGFLTADTIRVRPAACVAGSCNRVAPDAGNEGMDLSDVAAVRLMVCAPGVQTLAGTGTMEAWVWDPKIQRAGDLPTKNITITRSDACQGAAVELNGMAGDGVRLTYRAVGVAVSGVDGGSLLVSVTACKMGRKNGCAP